MKLNAEFQDPDRKKKIKWIIAREGLVILGTIFVVFIFTRILSISFYLYLVKEKTSDLAEQMRLSDASYNEGVLPMIVFAYGTYLLMRFILWAIKTLREK